MTSCIGIATAATNHNTRHPMVTVAFATTMHRLTGGRFTLGIGCGVPPLQRAFGMPAVTTAQMVDFADVMRRLFPGETVVGHDGPFGSYPASLDESSRAMARATGADLREVRFYERFAAMVGARTPICFYAELAEDGVGFTLLLETSVRRPPSTNSRAVPPNRRSEP